MLDKFDPNPELCKIVCVMPFYSGTEHLAQQSIITVCLLFLWCPAGPVLRSAVLEDCVLCQETISSSEVAAKAREGQFEGQNIYKKPVYSFIEILACSFFSVEDRLIAGDRPT